VAHPLSSVLASQERSGSWLARKTGKSPAYVTKVIQGTRRPSEDFKERAAAALGVPVALLFPSTPESEVA
jgi:transcriptional regulator with XRE-family HTH domain